MIAFVTGELLQHINFVLLKKSVNPSANINCFLRIEQLTRHKTLFEMHYTNVTLRSLLVQNQNEDYLGGDAEQEFLILASTLHERLSAIKLANSRCILREFKDGVQLCIRTPTYAEHRLFCPTYYGNPTDAVKPVVETKPYARLTGLHTKRLCHTLQSVAEFREDTLANSTQPMFGLRFSANQCVALAAGAIKKTLTGVYTCPVSYEGVDTRPVDIFIYGMLLNRIEELLNNSDTLFIELDRTVSPQWIRIRSATRELLYRLPPAQRPAYMIELEHGRFDPTPANGTLMWTRCCHLSNLAHAAKVQTSVGDAAKHILLSEDGNNLVVLQQDNLDGKNQSALPIVPSPTNDGQFTTIQLPGSIFFTTAPTLFRPFIDSDINPDGIVQLSLWRFERPKPSNTNRYIYFLRLRLLERPEVLLSVAIVLHPLEGVDSSD